ncbi:MAG: hypothetical protein AAB932_02680, partial [Patescibacteria group bacterium]
MLFQKFILPAVFFFILLANITPASAQPYLGLEYGRYTNLSNQDVRVSAARIINVVLGLLGIIVTVLIVYAGFRWMTAAGNEDAVKDARKIMFAAVIGLIIVLAAFAIS